MSLITLVLTNLDILLINSIAFGVVGLMRSPLDLAIILLIGTVCAYFSNKWIWRYVFKC